jgi:hypothetical protein
VKMSPSAQNLEAALAACLDDLQAGMTPAQCLARYPEYADQLEPLLLTAERLQGQPWPTLSTSGRVRGRERMHAALASRRPAGFAWWTVLRPLSVAVMLLALAGGVWLAWPGRQTKTTDLPTSVPVVLPATPSPAPTLGATATLTLTVTATLTLTVTATLTLTVTATPTGTADDTNPVPTETNVPEVIEGADGTETPFATATLRTRNTPTSGDPVSTPVPTLPGSPAATVDPSRSQETPQNADTPEAAAEATETRTPPGGTPTLSKTREPKRTPEPSRTAVATEAPHATATREPSPTAEPIETPQATATNATTRTPEPSKTPAPTKTPEAAKTSDHD